MMATARLAAWLVLVGLGTLARASRPGPSVAVAIVGATLVGAQALARTLLSLWQGPPVIEFAPEDGLLCGEEDSEPVRAYAQLRGMIGGAGHVHPSRLVLPLVAWAAALAAGARPLFWPELEVVGAVPAAVAVSSAFATWLFPAQAYWYREVMGGRALVAPREAVAALVARERRENGPALAGIRETGRADPILRTPSPEPEVAARSRAVRSPGPQDGARYAAGPQDALEPPERQRAGGAAPTRPPRYAVERRIIVEQDGVELEVATLNVSAGGLAVRWPAELPVVGRDLVVRLEGAERGGALDAIVCWNGPGGGPDRSVGLRVFGGGRAGQLWRELVEGAAVRSGDEGSRRSSKQHSGWRAES